MTTTNEARLATGAALTDADSLRDVSLAELLSGIKDRVKLLVNQDVELAKAEIKSDIGSEIAMVRNLGIAAVCAVLSLNMLLVAVAFALSTIVPGWAASLILAAPFVVLTLVMGAFGWAGRVRKPLEVTRATLKEQFEWTKNRLA